MEIEQEVLPEPIHGVFTPLWQHERREVNWVIPNQLPVGMHFMAGSPKKSKKSTLALAQALMVAGHKHKVLPFHMSHELDKNEVMVFSHEAEGGILRQAAEDGLGIIGEYSDESILVADEPWTFRLDEETGRKRLINWMEERRPRLVIIDPLNRQQNADENSASEMTAILGPLGKVAHELQLCILIIHHISKPSKDNGDKAVTPYDMRGTSALYGMADGITTVTPRKGGFLQLDSVFKRADDFSRTIRLGIWGEVAKEWLSDLDNAVLNRLRQTRTSELESLADDLSKDSIEVQEALTKLERNHLVKVELNIWRALK